MVLFLILSIVSATFLLIILKKFVFWKINTLHGIIINYWVAASCAFLQSPSENIQRIHELETIWPVALVIGFMFIMVFFVIARTTQVAGIGVASVASKMSMVIPIAAGFILYNETMGWMKLAGIALSIPAVVMTSKPVVPAQARVKFKIQDLGLPLLLFAGAGLVDTAIKFAQHHYMNDENRQIVIMAVFAGAGTFGLIRLVWDLLVKGNVISLKSVGGGILLGMTNYYSLEFLVRCLAFPGSESSTIFAYVNTGVVLLSWILGLILFREPNNRNKLVGITMAIVAILILSYS
jgi:drug/metabolite transporter (DMT)-like permease